MRRCAMTSARRPRYQCVASSVAGFVQQLAVAYVAKGYLFYVKGVIPFRKDPAKTDVKILAAYDIAISKFTRARRKREHLANVQYLRHGRFYVILATHGLHPFFAAESKRLRDIRRHPIAYKVYSIGFRRAHGNGSYHASVRISDDRFRQLKIRFDRFAVHRTVEELCADLRDLPFEPYAPVQNQYCILLRRINRRRAVAGLELVPFSALRLRRSPVRPFAGFDTKAIERIQVNDLSDGNF